MLFHSKSVKCGVCPILHLIKNKKLVLRFRISNRTAACIPTHALPPHGQEPVRGETASWMGMLGLVIVGGSRKAGPSAPHIHPTNEDLFVGTPLTPQMMNHLRGPEPLR